MKKIWSLFCFAVSFSLAAQTIVVVATADLHGEMQSFALLAPAIQRQKPDVLIDAGDLFFGNYATTLDGGASMVAALNHLHYDAWVIGNHDLDLPYENLARRVTEFGGKALGNWQTPKIPGVVPGILLVRKNVRIFIIGCGVPDQKERLIPDDDFTQNSYDEALEQGIAAARRARADIIILVAHRGLYGKDGALAALLMRHPGIDLVFGSHTHQSNRGENVGDTYFVQTSSHAQNAACAVITWNEKKKKIEQVESFLFPRAESGDATLEALFADAEKSAAKFGDTPEIMLSKPLRLPCVGTYDCDFVHFAAEALLHSVDCDAAIYDGYADERILTSPATPRKLFALAPYCGRIVVCRLTREEVRGVMEEMVQSMSLTKPGAVPGFAGIRYALKRKKLIELEIPSELNVALGSYRFCRSTALAAVRRDRRRWRDTGIWERDAIWNEIIRRNQK